MPPKCCKSEAIPLENVAKLYDSKFKTKWNRKYQEYTTKNRTYCPSRGCGEWIKPSHIRVDTGNAATYGRKYGVCKKCKTKVCCLCNNKWHTSRDCPKDKSTKEFIKLAQEKGWQQCYNCKATVELREGCNHMTCACKADFCMCCGLKWKTCDCQMFSDEAILADRLEHLGPPNPAAAERAFRQERRDQEMRDETMARRMSELGLHDDHDDGFAYDDGFTNHAGFGGDDFLDDMFRRRAADALSATFNPFEGARRPEWAPFLRPEFIEPQYHNRAPAFERWNNDRPPGRHNERLEPRRPRNDYAREADRHRPIVREARLAGMERGQTRTRRMDDWQRDFPL